MIGIGSTIFESDAYRLPEAAWQKSYKKVQSTTQKYGRA